MNFYVYKDDTTYGPLDQEGLRYYLNAGTFTEADSACEVGSSEWKSVGRCLNPDSPSESTTASTQVTVKRTTTGSRSLRLKRRVSMPTPSPEQSSEPTAYADKPAEEEETKEVKEQKAEDTPKPAEPAAQIKEKPSEPKPEAEKPKQVVKPAEEKPDPEIAKAKEAPTTEEATPEPKVQEEKPEKAEQSDIISKEEPEEDKPKEHKDASSNQDSSKDKKEEDLDSGEEDSREEEEAPEKVEEPSEKPSIPPEPKKTPAPKAGVNPTAPPKPSIKQPSQSGPPAKKTGLAKPPGARPSPKSSTETLPSKKVAEPSKPPEKKASIGAKPKPEFYDEDDFGSEQRGSSKKIFVAFFMIATLLCGASAGATWFIMKSEPAPVEEAPFELTGPAVALFEMLNRDARVVRALGSNVAPQSPRDAVPDEGMRNWNANLAVAGSEYAGVLSISSSKQGDSWIFEKLRLDPRRDDAALSTEIDLIEPSADEREMLIESALERFRYAMETNNFTEFYRDLHPDFQAETSSQELTQIFAGFQDFNFFALDGVVPVVTEIQRDDSRNLILFMGYYSLDGFELWFKITYAGFPDRQVRGMLFELKPL